MKILSLILTVLFSCLFITGVILAANTFPTTLNSWGSGDTISSSWANALEAKIGADSSAVVTSIDYLIKNTGSKLGKIASLGVTDNNIIVATGTTWAVGTPGTDYSAGTAALGTGILKSTTTTGALTIAIAGDFPTLNQNTSGSSASCTGNSATVTGFTRNTGTLTLVGADALTLTTSGTTNATFPLGTKTLVATDGNISGSSGSCTGNANTCTTASAGDTATSFFSSGTLEDGLLSFTLADCTTDGGCTNCITDGMVSNTLTSSTCSGNAATATSASGLACTDCVQANEISTINCGTNCTWDTANDEIDIDDKFLKNDATDIGVGLTFTGDNTSADTAYVPMTLFNTDATPPAASGFPRGTIYIQYTP